MESYNEINKFEEHKRKIIENIDAAKEMNVNKITAILAISDESDDIQRRLVNWLIMEGYKIALRKDEYSILTIEWD